MDIANITAETQTIEILHPASGKPIGVRLQIVDESDERVKAVQQHIATRRLQLEARNKTFDGAQLEKNGVDLICAAVVGWEWYSTTDNPDDRATFNGEVPEFNAANVRRVITESHPVLFAKQISSALFDNPDFFTNTANG